MVGSRPLGGSCLGSVWAQESGGLIAFDSRSGFGKSGFRVLYVEYLYYLLLCFLRYSGECCSYYGSVGEFIPLWVTLSATTKTNLFSWVGNLSLKKFNNVALSRLNSNSYSSECCS
uniref:Uncharacterized protein n=1 Tax=Medicago truncatula TaxID=3880 RepID=Q2HS54_MEDTR|nr:hypothetical protein MtrDRAFT_AC157373g25v2 [Medicago truncatula]